MAVGWSAWIHFLYFKEIFRSEQPILCDLKLIWSMWNETVVSSIYMESRRQSVWTKILENNINILVNCYQV